MIKRIKLKTKQNKKRIHNIIRNCRLIEGDGEKVIKKLNFEQDFGTVFR